MQRRSSTSSYSEDPNRKHGECFYAIKTFVASLEGQITVYKNDVLTLLDDSNSYWWLVRSLKSGEVGYVPAENLENENERVARFNKDKNVTGFRDEENYDDFIKGRNISKSVSFDSARIQYRIIYNDEENSIIEEDESELESDSFEDESEEIEIEDKEESERSFRESEQESSIPPSPKTDAPRRKSKTSVLFSNTNVQILRIFASSTCATDSLYKTVLVTPTTTIDDIVQLAVDRFILNNDASDYFLTVVDIENQLVLDRNAHFKKVFESILNRDIDAGTSSFFEMLNQANISSVHRANIAKNDDSRLGSLWGVSDSKKLGAMKGIRFILNKRVNYSEKTNFFIRVYTEGDTLGHGKMESYKTIAVDSLMKVRDVIHLILPKFNLIREKGKDYELVVIKENESREKTELKLHKHDNLVEILQNYNLIPSTVHFLLRVTNDPVAATYASVFENIGSKTNLLSIINSTSNRPLTRCASDGYLIDNFVHVDINKLKECQVCSSQPILKKEIEAFPSVNLQEMKIIQ
ncbi:hypothetical protein O9G_003826 [Rozella allomycis CSF55]|uniref:SH3 domain-containing protein n=1 Tax=Rozella allomycis (strain CSF55) TaxID=988480 RepID=A0A075AYL5_ROZAC|nr:hypothetical protein O9G_003826 [Rozella allomycis CSF55]|eukprot:EPZ35415.1 hypothetical protein O9G_003826 [Rozella allomycis CSF55]